MFKGRLILEMIGGEAVDKEIEIAEGEGLIFRVRGANFAKIEETTERIAKFLRGEEKFMIISGGDIEIIKLKTGKADGE